MYYEKTLLRQSQCIWRCPSKWRVLKFKFLSHLWKYMEHWISQAQISDVSFVKHFLGKTVHAFSILYSLHLLQQQVLRFGFPDGPHFFSFIFVTTLLVETSWSFTCSLVNAPESLSFCCNPCDPHTTAILTFQSCKQVLSLACSQIQKCSHFAFKEIHTPSHSPQQPK